MEMKRIRTLIQTSVILAVPVFFASCDKDGGKDNGGESAVSVFNYDGIETPVAKAFADADGDMISFFATPDSGVENPDEFYAENSPSYIWLHFDKSFATGSDYDIMEEPFEISGYNSATGEYFLWDADNTDTFVAGTLNISYNDASTVCKVSLTVIFSSGKIMSMTAEAVVSGKQQESGSANTIIINNETKPIRAAFFEDTDDGRTHIYLTSANIEYLEELELAVNYVELVVDSDETDGEKVNIADTDKYFEISFTDNFSGTTTSVSSENVSSLSMGEYTVSRSPADPSEFSVKIVVVLSGTAINAEFSGNATSADKTIAPPANEYFFNNEAPVAIQSAILDKSGNLKDKDGNACWEIWLSSSANLTGIDGMDADDIHIVIPSVCFDGNIYGLSVLKDDNFYVEHRNVKWVYDAAGEDIATGTVEASVKGNELTVNFYNLYKGTDSLEGYYSGTATIIE